MGWWKESSSKVQGTKGCPKAWPRICTSREITLYSAITALFASSSTLNMAFGRASVTIPSISMLSFDCLAIITGEHLPFRVDTWRGKFEVRRCVTISSQRVRSRCARALECCRATGHFNTGQHGGWNSALSQIAHRHRNAKSFSTRKMLCEGRIDGRLDGTNAEISPFAADDAGVAPRQRTRATLIVKLCIRFMVSATHKVVKLFSRGTEVVSASLCASAFTVIKEAWENGNPRKSR